jgi:predicted CopG family antitoxin
VSAHWQVEKQGEQPLEESMRNITVTVPDDVYRRARVWAAERDTSVSAVVKYLLETMPGMKRSNLAFPARNSNPVNTLFSSPTPPPQ